VRKQAEHALKANEAELRLIEYSQDIIVRLNAQAC